MKNVFSRCCKTLAIKTIELMTWNYFMKNNEVASRGLCVCYVTKEINERSTHGGRSGLLYRRQQQQQPSKYDLFHPIFLYRNIYICPPSYFCVWPISDERKVRVAS